jgi:hypothetical protein
MVSRAFTTSLSLEESGDPRISPALENGAHVTLCDPYFKVRTLANVRQAREGSVLNGRFHSRAYIWLHELTHAIENTALTTNRAEGEISIDYEKSRLIVYTEHLDLVDFDKCRALAARDDGHSDHNADTYATFARSE